MKLSTYALSALLCLALTPFLVWLSVQLAVDGLLVLLPGMLLSFAIAHLLHPSRQHDVTADTTSHLAWPWRLAALLLASGSGAVIHDSPCWQQPTLANLAELLLLTLGAVLFAWLGLSGRQPHLPH